MTYVTIIFSLLMSIMYGQVPLDDSDKEATIDVYPVDSSGAPIPLSRVEVYLRRLTNGQEGPNTIWSPSTRLKYGPYRLIVRGTPGYPVEKVIRISEAHQLFLVALFPARIETTTPWVSKTVRGSLSAFSKERGCLWVRLISPVSESDFADAKALNGTFVFQNVKPGNYILQTLGPEGLCEVKQTKITGESVQELTLK